MWVFKLLLVAAVVKRINFKPFFFFFFQYLALGFFVCACLYVLICHFFLIYLYIFKPEHYLTLRVSHALILTASPSVADVKHALKQ